MAKNHPQKQPVKKAPHAAAPKTRPASSGHNLLFTLFTGFLILIIPVFYYKDAMDITLMPRLLVVSAFLFLLAIWLFSKKQSKTMDYSTLRAWIFPVVAAYLLITLLSATWAINVRESYFDIARTSLFLFTMMFASFIFLNHEGWQEKLPKFVSVASLLAVIIGVVQYFDKVYSGPEVLADGREAIYAVVGVMSHKNEFSNALMLMLPFLAYGVYSLRREWRFVTLVALLLNLMMILILKTRAVWVGISLSVFVTGLMLVFFGQRVKLPRTWRILFAAGIIAATAAIAIIYSMPKRDDDFSFIGRVQNITNIQSQHNIHRIHVWEATLEMIREKPLTGVGAGNWQMLIAPHCKGMFTSIAALNWGRPHNDFLWVWAEKGIFGILLYLTAFSFAFLYLFQVFFRSPRTKDRMLALLLAGGILSYLAISFFSFPYERINHTVYLALFMAAAVVLRHRMKPAKPVKTGRGALLAASLLFLGFGVLYGYNATEMEIYMKRTIAAENKGRYEEAIEWAKKAMNPYRSLNPMAYPPEYYVAKSDYQIGKKLIAIGQKEAGLKKIREAMAGFEYTLTLFPGNVWTVSRMGLIYNDLEEYDKMIESLEYLLELVPALNQERKAMAGAYFKKGDYPKAIETLKNVPGYQKQKDIMQNIKALEQMIEDSKAKSQEPEAAIKKNP